MLKGGKNYTKRGKYKDKKGAQGVNIVVLVGEEGLWKQARREVRQHWFIDR
jgi:hypothetical protein